jgi:hypothetical protein
MAEALLLIQDTFTFFDIWHHYKIVDTLLVRKLFVHVVRKHFYGKLLKSYKLERQENIMTSLSIIL